MFFLKATTFFVPNVIKIWSYNHNYLTQKKKKPKSMKYSQPLKNYEIWSNLMHTKNVGGKKKISNKENKKDTTKCTCYDRCWNKHY